MGIRSSIRVSCRIPSKKERAMRLKIPVLLLIAVPLVLAGATTWVHAATDVYVCIQGVVGDSNVQPDCIDVLEFHHLVKGDSAQEHESIVFVKRRFDSSTVDLLSLLHNSDQREMTFYFATMAGETELYYRIDLYHAVVVAVEPWSRDDGSEQLERIRISYDEMRITHVYYPPSGGQQSEDYLLTVP
jgi:type VI secretion system Hcp family effector